MPAQDSLTSAEITITGDHSYIHRGMGYSVVASTTGLAAAGTWKVGFTTPNLSPNKYVHWRPAQFSSSANAVRYRLYEGSIFTGGSPSQPINRNRNRTSKSSNVTFYSGATAALAGNLTVTTKAGGNFANQPTGDGVEVLSDSALDIGQTVTIYGTITGATATVTSETVTLNGVSVISTSTITWQNILGVELSAVCAGTITIRKATGDAAITTIAPASLNAGVETPSITNSRSQILIAVASGATTKPVGVIGTSIDSVTALTSVVALNGNTPVNVNSSIFYTISKVLIGAVESARTVSVTIPEKILSSTSVGSGNTSSRSGGSGGGSDLELVLQPNTSYVAYFENIGAATATDIDVDFFFYEEENY